MSTLEINNLEEGDGEDDEEEEDVVVAVVKKNSIFTTSVSALVTSTNEVLALVVNTVGVLSTAGRWKVGSRWVVVGELGKAGRAVMG